MRTQRASDPRVIYNGRPYDLQAPPIKIFHPVFAHFFAELAVPLKDLAGAFSADELYETRRFLDASAAFCDRECDRYDAIRDSLEILVHEDLCAQRTLGWGEAGPQRTFTPDGGVYMPGGKAPVVLLELVNSFGAKGMCDPMHQAQIDYACFLGLRRVRLIDCSPVCWHC